MQLRAVPGQAAGEEAGAQAPGVAVPCPRLVLPLSAFASHHIIRGYRRQRSQAGDGSGSSLVVPCVPSMLEDPWRQLMPRPAG